MPKDIGDAAQVRMWMLFCEAEVGLSSAHEEDLC